MRVKVKDTSVLIDKEHKGIFDSFNWHISDTGYAVWRGILNGKKKTIRLHRLIAKATDSEIVDHINRNKLDNRSSNLRIVDFATNIKNTDKYDQRKGYYFDNTKRRWTIDSKELGIKSLYMDSEKACIDYISDLRNGLNPVRVFTRRPSLGSRKLTDENIEYIFEESSKGVTNRAISKHLGVSESTVGRVVNGKTTMGGKISRRTKKSQ